MEGIKLSSESLFDKEQKFRDPPVGYKFDAIELHKLSKAPGQPDSAATKVLSLSQDNLCTWLSPTSQDNTVEHTPEASLRLVSIRRDLDVTLCISKSSFTTIFHSIKAHPSIKYTICRDYDGFHEFCGDGFRLTRFLGNPLYALVWTFDPDTMTTAAMFLDRRRHTFTKFTNMLREHSSLISTPSLLAFVSSYFLLQFFDLETGGWELNTVRTVEERTGFGPHPTGYRGLEPLTLVQSYDISQLTSWLQAMSEVAGNASNRARHVRMCLSVLKKIGDEHERREDHGIPGQVAERHRHSLAAIAKAIPQVEQHILTYIDYLMYLKDRSERLCTVVGTPIIVLLRVVQDAKAPRRSCSPCSRTKTPTPAST